VPAARPASQPAGELGAGPPIGGRGAAVARGVAVVAGTGRDVVVAGSRCDVLVEGIVLVEGMVVDASVVGTMDAGAVFGPEPAVRGWSPLHAETAKSSAIAPAQRRRHTV